MKKSIDYINNHNLRNGIVLFDAISIESEGGVVYFDDVSVVKKNYVELDGGERVYYYHNDHLGTPQVMTDITGNIVWKADYEPFGKVNILVERIENNFRFPGQYYIKETGLYYNWWRWYKSEIGRYMEVDPFIKSHELGAELFYVSQLLKDVYTYVRNNPVINRDIEGLISEDDYNKCMNTANSCYRKCWLLCYNEMVSCLSTTLACIRCIITYKLRCAEVCVSTIVCKKWYDCMIICEKDCNDDLSRCLSGCK